MRQGPQVVGVFLVLGAAILISMLLLLFFLQAGIQRKERLLQEGLSVEATVSRKQVSRQYKQGHRYELYVMYFASEDPQNTENKPNLEITIPLVDQINQTFQDLRGKGKMGDFRTAIVTVTSDFYEQALPGDKLTLVYLSEDPQTLEIKEQVLSSAKPHHFRILGALFLLGLIAFATVAVLWFRGFK